MADEEIPQEEAQEPAPPPPPAVRMVVEDYDANDAQHYAQWVASGRPDLPWQTTWYEDLAEDGETYVRRQQPEPGNLTDVEKMAQVFSMSEQQSASFLTQLKSRVWNYLADTDREGHLSPMEATAAGVNFCDSRSEYGIGLEYSDFITKGGHPLAAQALWDRIQAVKAKYEWFDSGVNAIFAEALGQI